MERKIGLDLLRAIAILVVLEQHARGIIISVVPQLSYFGSTDGVDIFFVLSGFLIGGILIRHSKSANFNAKLFLIRRWYRTLPNYVVAFLVSLIVYLTVNKSSSWDLQLIASTGFFVQNYLPPFQNFSFFSEAWSLSIEEHFYLTFTVILFVFYKFNSKKAVLKSIFVLAFIALISRLIIAKLHPIYNYDLYNSYIRIITPCRFDSMAVGVLFAYLKDVYPCFYHKKRNKLFMFFLGLLLCVCFDRTWLEGLTYTPSILLFYSVLFSVGVGLIIPFIESTTISNKVVGTTVSYISKVSYSLYLFHNFIFAQPFTQYTLNMSSQVKLLFYLLFWIIVFFVSYFTYTFIEKPFLRIRERRFPEKLDPIINH